MNVLPLPQVVKMQHWNFDVQSMNIYMALISVVFVGNR